MFRDICRLIFPYYVKRADLRMKGKGLDGRNEVEVPEMAQRAVAPA